MQITCNETDPKAIGPVIRTFAGEGFTVAVRSDDHYFTIYDSYDEPCGTMFRPRYNERHWSVYNCNGEPITETAVGPRGAFRSFLIWYKAV